MAQWLGVLADLAEDIVVAFSTHTNQLITPARGDMTPSSDLHRYHAHM